MAPGSTTLTEAERSVHLLKIEGYSASRGVQKSNPIVSKWNACGHNWEVRFFHARNKDSDWVALDLVLLDKLCRVRAGLGCRLVNPRQDIRSSEIKNASRTFHRFGDTSPEVWLKKTDYLPLSDYLQDDCLTVECTITVLKDLPEVVIVPSQIVAPLPVPPSDLPQQLGALLQSQKGGDVTFVLGSGERFLAHKYILAARSPVFMAAFFGNMQERSSSCVQIQDMEAAVFKAMLHFIYTDTAPELDGQDEDANIMAQHLLAAADRYGIERLKIICQSKLSSGIDVDTVATTLALAEQHNYSLLKAKCVDFIIASPERLDAVLATEGYMHLAASCPMVLADLLKAARGRKN